MNRARKATAAQTPPSPEAFLFDPASNLLEKLDGEEATHAIETRALPEPGSPNASRPQQTPGNRTEEVIERGARQGMVTRYRYNSQNQLIEVQTGNSTTRYSYDALGRRTGKVHLHAEHSEQDAQREKIQNQTRFYWNGDVLLGEVHEPTQDKQSSRAYVFEPFSFKPLALIEKWEVFHYHVDHIGTPREITNADAKVVWSSTFKTYGALALAHVNEVDNPLRFQGQYFDAETGLHYNRHRYYDPECGQFTTQGSIGLLGGLNVQVCTQPDDLGGSAGVELQRGTR